MIKSMESNFKIIIDTREQEPYIFDDSIIQVKQALAAGDYSLEGFENKVAVERKSLQDFIGTIIKGRKRFYKELNKLKTYDAACVVVEANYRDIICGSYRSEANPNSIIGTIATIIIDFGVPIYFCSDRQAAGRFTKEFLVKYYKSKEKIWKK